VDNPVGKFVPSGDFLEKQGRFSVWLIFMQIRNALILLMI
jgi:hypothetical protein